MEEIRIGQVLKRLLRDQRKTLKQVSRDTGIPYSTLHTWFENRQPKNILNVRLLAEYLGVSLHELLFGKPDHYDFPPAPPEEHKSADPFTGTYQVTVRRVE